jgi:hypothetical protein
VIRDEEVKFQPLGVHLELRGEPPRILKKARRHSPKDGATNVSDVSHSACLAPRYYRSHIKELYEEPKPD